MLLATLIRLAPYHPRYTLSFRCPTAYQLLLQLLSDYDVCHDSPPEPLDVHKQTLRRPYIYAGILDNVQQPAEDYINLDRSGCSVDSSINFSVRATTHGFDAVTRQVTYPTNPSSVTDAVLQSRQWDSIC